MKKLIFVLVAIGLLIAGICLAQTTYNKNVHNSFTVDSSPSVINTGNPSGAYFYTSITNQIMYAPLISAVPSGITFTIVKGGTGYIKVYPTSPDILCGYGSPAYLRNDEVGTSVYPTLFIYNSGICWNWNIVAGSWKSYTAGDVKIRDYGTALPQSNDDTYGITANAFQVKDSSYNSGYLSVLQGGETGANIWHYNNTAGSWYMVGQVRDSSADVGMMTGNAALGIHNLSVQHMYVGSGTGQTKAVVVRKSDDSGTCTLTFAAGILVSQDCTP